MGGVLRKRKDGMSELSLVGRGPVANLLKAILPYLRMKKPTAALVLEIIEAEAKIQNRDDFIEVCKKVDKIVEYTDSKTRTVTAQTVIDRHSINNL